MLDMKTLLAIYTNPDGISIIGAWNGVRMLAATDPEGCVRMTSGLPMDTSMLAGLFHCTESIVQKTIELFEKLRLLTVKDGLIRLTGCMNDNVTNRITASKKCESKDASAHKRELARLRQAERRARQKLEKEQQKENATATPETKCDKVRDEKRDSHAVTRDMRDKVRDRQRDMRDRQRDKTTKSRMNTASADSVTERDTQRDMRDNSNTVNNNINALNTLNALEAYSHLSFYAREKDKTETKNSFNPSGNCVPWHPKENGEKIPLRQLPETVLNVLHEYNKLPLPKYNGIIPSLLEKIKYLLQRYGENTVIKTIAGIANSAFLLGKTENISWTASLSWLMDAKNFAKVLSGKYRDDKNGYTNCISLHSGERLPFFLPGEGPEGFTPEERDQAIRDLFVPTTPAQLKAARLVLPGYKEVTA